MLEAGGGLGRRCLIVFGAVDRLGRNRFEQSDRQKAVNDQGAHRLRGNPDNLRREISQPEMVQLQPALIRDVAGIGGRPERARKMASARVAAYLPDRQTISHPMHIGLVERGGDRNAVLAHIPDVDNGDPRHAASLAPTDTKSGNRHATDTKSGNRTPKRGTYMEIRIYLSRKNAR
jgi:hypothetical protein